MVNKIKATLRACLLNTNRLYSLTLLLLFYGVSREAAMMSFNGWKWNWWKLIITFLMKKKKSAKLFTWEVTVVVCLWEKVRMKAWDSSLKCSVLPIFQAYPVCARNAPISEQLPVLNLLISEVTSCKLPTKSTYRKYQKVSEGIEC